MNNNHTLLIALIAIFFLLPIYTFAQGDPEAVPIDGGISLLIAAGVGYGLKKAYHHNNHKRKSS